MLKIPVNKLCHHKIHSVRYLESISIQSDKEDIKTATEVVQV